MKKILFTLTVLATGMTYSQVGVGNSDPKATLDVNKTSYIAGEKAGIAVTQLTASQIEGMNTSGLKAGTLVYATTGSGSIINTIGFWYYNGTTWNRTNGLTGSAPINVTSAGIVSLNDSGVTNAKIADNAVTSAKIADGTIATADVANNAITIAKLPTGATPSTFLKGDGTWSSIGSSSLSGFADDQLLFGIATGGLAQTPNLVWNNANNSLTVKNNDVAPAFNSINNKNGLYVSVAQFMAPLNIGIGNATQLRFGVSAGSSFNAAEWRFVYSGNESGHNRVDFGFTNIAAPVMTYKGIGNVGIGTINPTERLDVAGNFKFSGALLPNNLPGTSGQVLTSAGPNAAPTWTTLSSLNGKSVLNGTSNPVAGTGVDGDFYINTTSNTLFGPKTAGAWASGVSLVGPTGAQGPAGADGIAGTNGIDGKSILNGTSNPDAVTGVDGDFYINTVTNTLFGPKVAGAWASGVSLVGPAGSNAAVTGTAPIDITAGVVSLTDAGITTAKLADNVVNTAKLADNAVTISKLPAGATASKFLRGDGTWADVPTPTLPITIPTTDNYTVLETDAVIYRTLTANGTITFPSSLPAGKVFYISNNSTSYDWTFSPTPINTGVSQVFAGFSHMVVTLGGDKILVVSGN